MKRSHDVAVLCVSDDQSIGRYLVSRLCFKTDDPVIKYVGQQLTNDEAAKSQKERMEGGEMISYQVLVNGK